MSRPVSVQNEKLLRIARTAFLRYGYRVSTKLIASDAGVSEGTLFKRFKTKTALFVAAMECVLHMRSRESRMIKNVNAGDIRKTLESLGLQLLQRLHSILPCIMMIQTSGITHYKSHCNRGFDTPSPFKSDEYLASYFGTEIRQGRLVMTNPELKAQIFLGALISYEFREIIFLHNKASPEEYVRTVADMIISPCMFRKKQKRVRN